MNPLVLALVQLVVPVLVNFVEKLISRGNPDSGPAKRQWVIDAVHAMVLKLDAHVPDFLKPEEAELEKLIDDAINAELSKWGVN